MNSATLLVNLRRSVDKNDKTKVTFTQRVSNSAVIHLDWMTLDDINEDITVKLDVKHAIQAWIENPDLNLGLQLHLEGVEVTLDDSTPELVIDTKHSNVRRKRATYMSTEFGELITSWTDCKAVERGRKCCRYISLWMNSV